MDVRTVNAPDYTWETVLDREGLFDYSFPVLIQANNDHMRHGTVDFGKSECIAHYLQETSRCEET